MPTTGLHLGLSSLFIRKKLLTEAQIAAAIAKFRQNNLSLVTTMVSASLLFAR